MNKPNVLLIMEDIAPSQYFVYHPLQLLHRRGEINFMVNLESRIRDDETLNNYDLIVFSRNHSKRTIGFIEHLIQKKIPYIFEIDDDLFQLPIDYPNQREISGANLDRLSIVIKNAAMVRVFSTKMAERVNTISQHVKQELPPLFWSMISTPKHKSKKITITYATSRYEKDPLFEIISDALKIILKKYEDSIEIVFWGYYPKDFRNKANTKFIPFMRNYQKFLSKFSTYGLDIGLAPMSNNPFCQAKTDNKFREYGACNIAGIYSQVDLYNEIVNGETGLLVENQVPSWVNAISLLIENQDQRDKIIDQANQFVRSKYSEEEYVLNWEQDIFNTIEKYDLKLKNDDQQNNNFKDQVTSQTMPQNKSLFILDPHRVINYGKRFFVRVTNYFANRIELLKLKANL
jgi:glycosyltransferase involved in cell wall biosynthesis